MTDSGFSHVVLGVIGDRPPRDANATCEGCGVLGSVGRATRIRGFLAEYP